ncbi:monocarboxylate transporter 9-like isoform X3 [Periplaneta americana]|uniref:monocarboxylate transporter 9-like isoform X3 n=1 Tax=Periplaneta americana TaxID=6978 RepID=UPI0037E71210
MGGISAANGRHKQITRYGQTKIEESLRPPEGGWGWMVAFGMALMLISTTGQYLSFGPLFSGILEQLGEQTTGATVIMTALTASVNFTGLVTNHLLRSMTYRTVAVLGALLFTLGILLTIFAHSMVHIVITYSIIAGIGMGLVAPSSYLAINSYFVSRRGLAMGICQAAIGLGFIAVPYLVQAMLNTYGFRGTMLLLGGIALNSVVGALLYHPVEWHMIRLRLHKTISKEEEGLEEVPIGSRPISMVGVTPLNMDVIPDEEDDLAMAPPNGQVNSNANSNGTVSNRFTEGNRDHTWSLLRQTPDEAEEEDYSTFSKPSTSSDTSDPVIRTRKSSWCVKFVKSLIESLDLALLKDPVYVNIVLGLSLSFVSDTIFFTVFPFHLAQKPWPACTEKEVALCLSITAGADAAARLILPILADRFRVGPRAAYLLGCFSSAIARSIFASVQGFMAIAIMSGVVGFLKGAIMVNQSLTIAEHCPLERFAAAYSLFMVINALITLSLGPLMGVVRDETNSYPISIHVLSAILFLCVLMWLMEYFWVSYRTHTLRSVTHTLKTRLC